MSRMKTFFMYLLIFVLFYFISNVLEEGLIFNMYKDISKNSKINDSTYINGVYNQVEIIDKGSKATNVNGYINFSIKNNMDSEIEKCFLKVDLYNDRDQLAESKDIEVNNLKPGEERQYQVKFDASNIKRYEISVKDQPSENPDTLRILGWDVNLKEIADKLGIDLSNVFGIDLTNLSLDKLKQGGLFAWNYVISFAKSIPTWAYVIATGIVLWHLPSGYLFFL